MNRISLTLKSRGLEKEYHLQQMTLNKRKFHILLLTYLAISIMNLINLSINYLNRKTSNQDGNSLQLGEYYVILAFLIGWILSVVMNLILLHLVPEKINIYYTLQLLLNVIYHLILVKYNLNSSEGVQSSETSSNSRTQFHVEEGLFLAVIVFRGLIGTQFLLKTGIAMIMIVSLLVICYNQQERPYIQIPLGIVCLFIVVSQLYEEDKSKRQEFLVRRKDEEWNKIIKNVLPTNLIIAKYNEREERIELEQANRKANRELGITDNDSFSSFTNQTLVQRNEIISNEKDLHRIFKRNHAKNGGDQSLTEIKTNLNIGPMGNGNNNNNNISIMNIGNMSKKEEKNTLYSLIRTKIEEELRSRKRVTSSSFIEDGEMDASQNEGISSTKVLTPSNLSKKRSISMNNSIKKVNEFIGTYRSNGFDVDKKLMIRVSTFSLSEVFAVITIENETYREKYIKQIKFSTFLEKIFSFQLKKFKESYQIVLNELNRISNTEVQNQLLYHNVKCVNRVNSYLQYFEFKNANKHQFVITQFSLSSEIYKILNSLRKYISGKRIRTFYENVTSITNISTDEERLQQIFFMILEHLLVNAPKDGYMAIRITNDQTIANCFKVQIQSTYDSELLNSISLHTFSIDELYSDYEIYQNYFVSLRIAIKLITLMGPYNKIDFQRPEPGILFTSFSIFSDLEVIKQQQQIRTLSNLPQSQLQPHHNMFTPNKKHSILQPNTIKFTNLSPGGQDSNNDLAPFNKQQDFPMHRSTYAFKKFGQSGMFQGNSQNNLDDGDDSQNVSDIYDEEYSFNQWFKVKQMQYSSLTNHDKVFTVHQQEPSSSNSPQIKANCLPSMPSPPRLMPNSDNIDESLLNKRIDSSQQPQSSINLTSKQKPQITIEADCNQATENYSPAHMITSSQSLQKQEISKEFQRINPFSNNLNLTLENKQSSQKVKCKTERNQQKLNNESFQHILMKDILQEQDSEGENTLNGKQSSTLKVHKVDQQIMNGEKSDYSSNLSQTKELFTKRKDEDIKQLIE